MIIDKIRHLHISLNARYLPPPPPTPPKKILHDLWFSFLSWIQQPSQEKLKTMLMQNLGGQIRCIIGDVQVANNKTLPDVSGLNPVQA